MDFEDWLDGSMEGVDGEDEQQQSWSISDQSGIYIVLYLFSVIPSSVVV